jgi:hypothetical protein
LVEKESPVVGLNTNPESLRAMLRLIFIHVRIKLFYDTNLSV